MDRRHFLLASFLVLVVLTVLDFVGIFYSLYWRIWWYDIPAHILGGICVALGAAWLQVLYHKTPTLLFCVVAALGVGIAWEIFEASFALTQFPQDTLDTIKDLLDDTIGGAIVGRIVTRLRHS